MTLKDAFCDIKKLCKELCSLPSVSGGEDLCTEQVKKAVFDYTSFFDSFKKLPNEGLLFVHECGKKDAPKLLFDAHLDTVGFTVTEILDSGFLRVCPVGGVDKRLVFASEIEIFGKEKIKGVFVSTPPHLASKEGENSLPDIKDIVIDTGLSEQKLRDTVSVGDICTFSFSFRELLNDRISSPYMDDKICAVSILLAAKMMEEKAILPECDIIFSFSSAEEINGTGGEALGKLMCDGAVVLDVNFGRDTDIHENESYILGDGCGVSYSATTSKFLTDALVNCAKENDIPICTLVETKNTGTNAHYLSNAYLGTPCAVLSVPEKYMHSPVETVDMNDVYAVSSLLCEFSYKFPEIAKQMEESRRVLPLCEV